MHDPKPGLEFEDRNVVDDLADKMTVASWMLYFLAAVRGVSAAASFFKPDAANWGAVVHAVIFFVFGFINSQSATAFKIVVNSSSNQLGLLIDALRKLRRQYTVIYWFVLITVLLNVLTLFSL